MALVLGLDCKGYRNTGTFGTPVWNEITIAKDVTLNITIGEADASARASTYRRSLMTLTEVEATATILADTAIDDYNSLRDASVARTTLDLAIADGAIATVGTQYFRADFGITSWNRNEPLEEAVTVDLTFRLKYSTNAVTGFVTVV